MVVEALKYEVAPYRVRLRHLAQVKAELDAFIDEQRVFCGFIDTEQRLTIMASSGVG